MHRRGIRVLPGGDYGFAWTPHGTYARDLQHFVERLGFTPMEAIISATAWGGQIMLRPDELGQVQPGYLADMILVDGNPLDDITILQDHDKLRLHHEGRPLPQGARRRARTAARPGRTDHQRHPGRGQAAPLTSRGLGGVCGGVWRHYFRLRPRQD